MEPYCHSELHKRLSACHFIQKLVGPLCTTSPPLRVWGFVIKVQVEPAWVHAQGRYTPHLCDTLPSTAVISVLCLTLVLLPGRLPSKVKQSAPCIVLWLVQLSSDSHSPSVCQSCWCTVPHLHSIQQRQIISINSCMQSDTMCNAPSGG